MKHGTIYFDKRTAEYCNFCERSPGRNFNNLLLVLTFELTYLEGPFVLSEITLL